MTKSDVARTFSQALEIWILLTSLPICHASAQDPRWATVGEPAPPLELDGLLNAPADTKADWNALRGNVVVLEFWSTRCGPCIQVIPEMNKLKERFEGKPIVFISITDEEEGAVKSFLRKSPKKGFIGIDRNRALFRSYQITGLPETALINAEGRLLGWIDPRILIANPEILSDLLIGKKSSLISTVPDKGDKQTMILGDLDGYLDSPWKKNEAPLCLVLIRPAQQSARLRVSGDGRFLRLEAVTRREAIAHAYEVPIPFVHLADSPADDKLYDIILYGAARDKKKGSQILRNAIEASFGVSVGYELLESDAYILARVGDSLPNWESGPLSFPYDSESGFMAASPEMLARMKAGEKFAWTVGSSKVLAEQLANLLGRPVIDEAKIDGYFLFSFPTDPKAPDHEEVVRTLHKQYGLTLTNAKREIEIVVVKRASVE